MHRFNTLIQPMCWSATLALLLSAVAPARWSEPVRNLHPEEPSAQPDVQHPIYYTLPIGTVSDAAAPAPEALLQEFMNKHTATNYMGAAEAALRLINAVPDRPAGYYNLACAMARMQRVDEAFDALQKAVEHGWRDLVHMRIDPDLRGLHDDARFASIADDLSKRIESERIAPSQPRSGAWETVVGDVTRETPALLARYHVPGASVALIRNGQVVWSAAFGTRDVRSNDPLRADDRFRLRAPLHLLAIAACQQLEDQRKVQFASLIVRAANEHGVSTTAQPRGGTPPNVGARPTAQPANIRGGDGLPGESVTPNSSNGQAAGVPGRVRNYTRASAYGFLRLAIEDAADDTFANYCEQAILDRMGLTEVLFAAPRDDVRTVVGHSDLGTPLRPSVVQGEFAPDGCVYMTAGDLARLVASGLWTPPPAREGDPHLLGAQDNAIFGNDEDDRADGGCRRHGGANGAMPRFAAAIDMVTQADAAMSGSLGLALQRAETSDGVRYELSESASGIVCLARWRPHTRDGVVVLCNSATGREAAERIAHLALGGE